MFTEAQSSLFPESNFSETPNSSIPQKATKKRKNRNSRPETKKPVELVDSYISGQEQTLPPATSPSDRAYLTDKEVALRYSVSKATIWRWANSNPNFPKPIVFSKGVSRWSLEDLLAFEALKKGEAK
ncbi:putative DNA-binding transcriptional regulator AlpA [Labrenzia sp. EL_142]|nr:putative DNA-binding transcriptional regulator AlpA [Labrenzia sp. EL_142]